MDKKLDLYFKSDLEMKPPHINEYKIQKTLAERKQRWLLVSVSIAALLWMLAVSFFSVFLYRENQTLALAVMIALGVGMTCAGIFSCLVLKFRKVGI